MEAWEIYHILGYTYAAGSKEYFGFAGSLQEDQDRRIEKDKQATAAQARYHAERQRAEIERDMAISESQRKGGCR